jgi:hypothetical protein
MFHNKWVMGVLGVVGAVAVTYGGKRVVSRVRSGRVA